MNLGLLVKLIYVGKFIETRTRYLKRADMHVASPWVDTPHHGLPK